MATTASPKRPARARATSAPLTAEPGRLVWTRERYERAVGAGVFGPDDRVHLIDGEVVARMSQNPPHRTATLLLAEALRAAFAGVAFVQEEKPVALSDVSLPEPDVAVVRGTIRAFAAQHPDAGSVLLLAEVADTSLVKDRQRMAALYAEAGVPEYWIVNLAERAVEVYRDPSGEAYRTKTTHADGETVTPLHARGAALPVADLLP